MVLNLWVAFENLIDRNGDPVAFDHDIAFRYRPVVGKDHHRLVLVRIELDHSTTPHAEQLVHGNDGTAEHNRDFDFDGIER